MEPKALLTVLILLTQCAKVQTYHDTVLRPNYGTVMHRIGGTNAAMTTWLHTFALPWPNPPTGLNVQLPNCEEDSQLCEHMKHMIK